MGLGLLANDALTYGERNLENVPHIGLSLAGYKRGGKKRLRIADVQVDDSEEIKVGEKVTKKKLVIVGGGWVSLSSSSSFFNDAFTEARFNRVRLELLRISIPIYGTSHSFPIKITFSFIRCSVRSFVPICFNFQ